MRDRSTECFAVRDFDDTAFPDPAHIFCSRGKQYRAALESFRLPYIPPYASARRNTYSLKFSTAILSARENAGTERTARGDRSRLGSISTGEKRRRRGGIWSVSQKGADEYPRRSIIAQIRSLYQRVQAAPAESVNASAICSCTCAAGQTSRLIAVSRTDSTIIREEGVHGTDRGSRETVQERRFGFN